VRSEKGVHIYRCNC